MDDDKTQWICIVDKRTKTIIDYLHHEKKLETAILYAMRFHKSIGADYMFFTNEPIMLNENNTNALVFTALSKNIALAYIGRHLERLPQSPVFDLKTGEPTEEVMIPASTIPDA